MMEQQVLSEAEQDAQVDLLVMPSPPAHPADKPLSSGPFFCHKCDKSYARPDHLVRHQRSHSQHKPFPCTVCGKEYSRIDVLKRHLSGHPDAGELVKRRKRDAVSGVRSRVGKACTPCATAKLKCENEKPCQRCREKGIACTSPGIGWPTSRAVDDDDDRSPVVLRRGRIDRSATTSSHGIDENADPAAIGVGGVATAPRENDTMPTHDATAGSTLLLPPPSPSPTQNTTQPCLDVPSRSTGVAPMHIPGEAEATQMSAASERPGAVPVAATHHFSPGMTNSFGESSLADFLDGIMVLPMTPRDFLDFGVSNVGTLDLSMPQDAALAPSRNDLLPDLLPQSTTWTPREEEDEAVAVGNAAFLRSIWRWLPNDKDPRNEDRLHLTSSYADMESPETRAVAGYSLSHHRVSGTLRDKIVATVLSVHEDPTLYATIASSFPTCETLTNLLHLYITVHLSQNDPWLHIPTLNVNDNIELATMMIAAGASLCSVPAIQRFGLALQEAVRLMLGRKCETDNSTTRHLNTIQASALQLQVGLWSGDKRKMEISESFTQPPITMMRRSGRFTRPPALSAPSLDDSTEILEHKWKCWATDESWKRLACHFLIHDMQASMACQSVPLLSPAEFSVEFPAAKELWSARDALTWRDAYLSVNSTVQSGGGLSVAEGIAKVSQLKEQTNIDLAFSAIIVIYCTWSAVHSSMQLNALMTSSRYGYGHDYQSLFAHNPINPSILHIIEQLHLLMTDWNGLLRPEMALISQKILLNLHVSFEQLQLFAGKEGEGEARRIFPIMQRWADSSDARKAVWRAGQILRAAKQCHPNHLRDFGAICVYHAGLTFWAYTIVPATRRKCGADRGSPLQKTGPSPPVDDSLVWLDDEDCPAVQRFINFNRSTPVVSNRSGEAVSLAHPKVLMGLCIELLRNGDNSLSSSWPLVDNLTQLMLDLGNAAERLLHGRTRRFEK